MVNKKTPAPPAPETIADDEKITADDRQPSGQGRDKSLGLGAPPPLHRVAVFSRTVSKPTFGPRSAPRIYYAPRRLPVYPKET